MTISTTDTITPACSNCGAIDVGTNFCESCGVSLVAQRQAVAPTAAAPAASATAPPPALAPAAAMPSAPVAGTAADPALGLRVAALVTFLLGLVITGSISVAQATVGNVPASATQWSDTVSAALVALFMLIAAAMARGSDGGTAVGILGALGYAVATPIIDFNTSSLDPGLYAWLPVIPPVFLFMAWAGGRSLKAGWAAVIAVVVIGYFSGKVSPAFGFGAANYEILRDGFFALGLTVVVLMANGFDGAKPGTRRANPVTRTALILLLLSFLLNSTAGSILGTGGAIPALVVVILLVLLAIVLGHVGFVRSGRRGERGRGLALTALILGYLVIALYLGIVVLFASFLGALSGGTY